METKPLSRVDIDHARALAELPGLADRVATLIRSVPDAEAPIPHAEWRIADAASHLICAFGWFIDFAQGWHSPYLLQDGAATNARLIAELGVRDKDKLAQMYLDRVRSYVEIASKRPPDQTVYWHSGIVVTLSFISCVAMGESMVHTYDIARAAKKPWRLDPQAASLFIGAVAPIVPFLVRPDRARGLTAAYEWRLRGGPTFVIRVKDGSASVEPSLRNGVDAHISFDPVGSFLLLYGRVTETALLATGRAFVWGRRPILGLKFGSLLAKP